MDVSSTAPLQAGAARAAVDGSALAINLDRLHGLASMVLDTSGKASDGVRLQAYKALHAMGVRVASLRRSDGKATVLDTDPVLEDGDTLVFSGKPASLALAEEKLLKG